MKANAPLWIVSLGQGGGDAAAVGGPGAPDIQNPDGGTVINFTAGEEGAAGPTLGYGASIEPEGPVLTVVAPDPTVGGQITVENTEIFTDYVVTIYGVNVAGRGKASSTNPFQVNFNEATGGTITGDAVRSDGTVWRTHKFTSNGTFTASISVKPYEIIMSGGAKGGTSSACCGSCATPANSGGTLHRTNFTDIAQDQPYTFTRGTGGNGGPWPYPCTGGNCSPNGGVNGTNSTLVGSGVSLTANGGGVNGANGPTVVSDIEGTNKNYVAVSVGGCCGDGCAGGKGNDGFLYIAYQVGTGTRAQIEEWEHARRVWDEAMQVAYADGHDAAEATEHANFNQFLSDDASNTFKLVEIDEAIEAAALADEAKPKRTRKKS